MTTQHVTYVCIVNTLYYFSTLIVPLCRGVARTRVPAAVAGFRIIHANFHDASSRRPRGRRHTQLDVIRDVSPCAAVAAALETRTPQTVTPVRRTEPIENALSRTPTLLCGTTMTTTSTTTV